MDPRGARVARGMQEVEEEGGHPSIPIKHGVFNAQHTEPGQQQSHQQELQMNSTSGFGGTGPREPNVVRETHDDATGEAMEGNTTISNKR